ncbi:MAG TPA: hypothetical protein EYP67_04205 [Methanosarcinales archaeon]|nr:hypothetical protein [Methanosarcinales archaeon]
MTVSVLLLGLVGSGCVDSEDVESATVRTYLEARSKNDYIAAANVVDSGYQSKGYIMLTWDRVDNVANKNITNITLTQNVSGNQAVVIANYTEIEYDPDSDNVLGEQEVTQYFRLENTDGIWLITEISPAPLPMRESTGKVKKTPLDLLTDNAIFLLPAAFAMLGVGVYLDRKDKAERAGTGGGVGAGGAGAKVVMLQSAQIAKFVRCIPSQMRAGTSGTIDVWIKNFNEQPYQNLSVTAVFPDSVRLKKAKLKFGVLPPGETAKQTWNIKLAAPGKFQISDVTVTFTFGGKKYAGALNPVWIQVA